MQDDEATRVIAIRHGETAWNVDTRIQGQLDIPLNETGRWQAAQAAAALVDEPIDAIYSSDLCRALETAQAIAAVVGQAPRLDPGLRERAFGSFQGLTFQEIEQQWPDDALRWKRRDPDFGPGGGETLAGFFSRSVQAASHLAARHPGQTIVIVAHGGVLDCLYRAATRMELQASRTWKLGNAAINRLLFTPAGFTLVGWSDTQHLDEAARDEFADGRSPDTVGHAA